MLRAERTLVVGRMDDGGLDIEGVSTTFGEDVLVGVFIPASGRAAEFSFLIKSSKCCSLKDSSESGGLPNAGMIRKFCCFNIEYR